DVHQFNNGKLLARLSLATSETYQNVHGQRVKNTHWHNLVAWGHTARVAEKHLRKGSKIAVQGKLVQRSYEDRHGVRRFTTEVVINDLLMIGPKAAKSNQ
ncbi:MAG: single-stranded DNA-binding protein, partial [Bacteroidota bacterium]